MKAEYRLLSAMRKHFNTSDISKISMLIILSYDKYYLTHATKGRMNSIFDCQRSGDYVSWRDAIRVSIQYSQGMRIEEPKRYHRFFFAISAIHVMS